MTMGTKQELILGSSNAGGAVLSDEQTQIVTHDTLAHEAALALIYAKISLTTSPCTSVRR
jgi:hypothetical protein